MGEDRKLKRIIHLRNPQKVIPQVLASVAAAIGFLNTGLIRGWSSPGVPGLVESGVIELSTSDISWISSLPLSGAFVGSLIAGYPMIKLGRRGTLILAAPFFSVAWLLVAFSTNKWMLLVGRFMKGFMSGVGNPASQIYIAECSSPRIRGALGSFTAIFLGLGILLGNFFGYFLSWSDEAILFACCPILQAICMYFVPYSPVWLMTKGKKEDARIALRKFRGRNANIEEEYDRILGNIERNADEGKLGFREIFSPAVLKPAVISLHLMLFQQLAGINAIVFNLVSIFKSTNSDFFDQKLSSVAIGFLMTVGTVLSIPLVDRAGRRILLMTSSVCMCIALTVMGLYFYLTNLDDSSSWNIIQQLDWLPLTTLMIYAVAFSIGYNSVPFIILGELLPVKFRNSLSGLCSGFNLIMGFVTVKTFPYLTETLGYSGTFWFYGCSCAVGSGFIHFCLPETKGRTIEEIEGMFTRRTCRLQNQVEEEI